MRGFRGFTGDGSVDAALRTRPGRRPDGGHSGQPDAAKQTGERGRGDYDGAELKKSTKLHAVVDKLGNLLALHVTAANEQDRDQVATLGAAVRDATGNQVRATFVDQGYSRGQLATDAADHGIALIVLRLRDAKPGFVLLPRRRVV